MRDQWLHEHQGPEARPTEAFAASLAETLQSEWRQPTTRVVHAGAEKRRSWLRPMLAAAAALAVLGGGAYVVGRDSKPSVTGDSTASTSGPTTPTTVAATVPPETTVAPTTPPTTLPVTPVVAATPEEQTVLDYLTALAEGRWADAAKLLGEGGLSLEERADLRPLFNQEGTLPDLSAALRKWCEQPALCQTPTAIATKANRVVTTFSVDGAEWSMTFVGATFEGSPLVQGLPLRMPPDGGSLADVVPCPTDGVQDVFPADLDGDSWKELVVVARTPDEPTVTVDACGTMLRVTRFTTPAVDNLAVHALDIEGDGVDELMLGRFSDDAFDGSIIRWNGDSPSVSGQEVTMSNPADGAAGTSFGCEGINGRGRLVQYSYEYEGGTDLSNSTALNYTVTVLADDGSVDPIPMPPGRFELPAQQLPAFRLIAGYCDNLPVITG
jgi:hypothetical protein